MNAEEFKQMFLPLHLQLYQTAFRLLQNHEDAEDVVQEAYMKLWDKRHELMIQSNPGGYCHTLVRRLCIDLWRQRVVRKETELDEDISGYLEVDVERENEMQNEYLQVKRMIRQLPEQQQKVMWMRDVCACSLDEIEQATGMTAVNIRSALSRARKKIREQLKQVVGI